MIKRIFYTGLFSFLLLGLPQAKEDESIEKGLSGSLRTRPDARTLMLTIPAPRGLITDRHGFPLAQTKIGYYLALNFPHLPDASDAEIIRYGQERIRRANQRLLTDFSKSPEKLLSHYEHRRWLPLMFSGMLTDSQVRQSESLKGDGLILHPTYVRFYPRGKFAPHLIGYVGKTRPLPTGPISFGDPMFSEFEGREGLEATFDDKLTGTDGRLSVLYNEDSTKMTEEVVERPVPGHTVVTTLDASMQKIAEDTLKQYSRRGAFVCIDIATGDILAMASWPMFDPNEFVPSISQARFAELQEDKGLPLFPRAYRGQYPPASTFKVVVALASLNAGKISPTDQFNCPTALYIGDRWKHNWNKKAEGMMNVSKAVTRSCNTWFYQVGRKTGLEPIANAAAALGFGQKSGIPLRAEAKGRIRMPNGRRVYSGDLANIAIGQGNSQASPLQIAQMMAAIGNRKYLPKVNLVKQVQDINNRVIQVFPSGERNPLHIDEKAFDPIYKGMSDVVNASFGTGKSAWIKAAKVAGKTGTAQWGRTADAKNMAWFAGFVPVDKPKYAFAAVYEGNPGEQVSGGSKAAPMVGNFFKKVYALGLDEKIRPVGVDERIFANKAEEMDESNTTWKKDENRRAAPTSRPSSAPRARPVQQAPQPVPAQPVQAPPPEPKKGWFRRLLGR